MPKFPHVSRHLAQMVGSVFEKFRASMQAQGENLVRFHLGDTYLPVAYPLPLQKQFEQHYPKLNRYCDTFGIAPLREVLAEKLRTDNHLPVEPSHLLLTAGATNALSCAVTTLLEPGEDLMVLTPAWPLFFGIAKVNRVNVVEAPLYLRLYDEPDLDIETYLEAYLTPQTSLMYLNSPNNPTGKVLAEDQLRQVARFAQKHNLWLISDEAYDGLTFGDIPHISIGSFEGMFEQTISVYTFSKSFMFAGLRLGYAVADSPVIRELNKVLVHQLYSPSTLAQQMMIEPVRTRHQWLPRVRETYQNYRDQFVDQLNVTVHVPQAGYFLFFSVADYLHGQESWQFVNRCIQNGVAAAPGHDFGADFSDYIRVCFTAETPERMAQGVARLNQLLA
ncbi:MAG: pyridoxal phosphate-dependent aminotransferase [Gemmatimonadetes bacterium]|nr:MAG: pyridoxal phosphate-dependent aminotransferase [Gemmatimonadota bacterium]